MSSWLPRLATRPLSALCGAWRGGQHDLRVTGAAFCAGRTGKEGAGTVSARAREILGRETVRA